MWGHLDIDMGGRAKDNWGETGRQSQRSIAAPHIYRFTPPLPYDTHLSPPVFQHSFKRIASSPCYLRVDGPEMHF